MQIIRNVNILYLQTGFGGIPYQIENSANHNPTINTAWVAVYKGNALTSPKLPTKQTLFHWQMKIPPR